MPVVIEDHHMTFNVAAAALVLTVSLLAGEARGEGGESVYAGDGQAATYEQAAGAGGRYQLIVVPLLTESPIRDFVDRVLVVDCDENTQIRRLVARDAESEGQARRILAAQASRDERLKIADDVVRNDGDLAATREQVQTLHHQYLALTTL